MLPRRIKIGNVTYQVKHCTQQHLGKDVVGEMDGTKCTIKIERRAARARKFEILLHECLHAMLLGHNFKDEEAIVLILGEGIASFLTDNPGIVKEAAGLRLSGRKKT